MIVELGLACGDVSAYFWSIDMWIHERCFVENGLYFCYDLDKVRSYLYVFRIIADIINVGL